MRIIDCEQRSPEWFEARKGVITASGSGPFWIKSGKVADEARKKKYCEKLSEIAGCEEPPSFETWAMKRGTELEPLARQTYEQVSGNEVTEVGFCIHENGLFGCSPDGFVGKDGLIEIKCPLPSTHVRHLVDGIVPTEHIWQLEFQMAITGRRWVDFVSFCPNLPHLIIRYEWNEQTDALFLGINGDLAREFEDARNIVSRLWAEQKGGK